MGPGGLQPVKLHEDVQPEAIPDDYNKTFSELDMDAIRQTLLNDILEYKTKLDKRGGNSFANWGEANKHYDLFLRAVLFSKIHVIVCMRFKWTMY